MTHQIRIAGTDIAYDCEPGQNLIDAALRANIELPYSCRKGVCGNCAGRVARGEVVATGGSLRNATCGDDQVLFCRATAATDVVLEPQDWRHIDPHARKPVVAKVYRNQLAAPDVSILQLRLPAGKRIKFQAGQYLQIKLPDGGTRSYSMANPPQESDAITLHVRHVPGGRFSAIVPDLAPGDLLDIEAPYGSFGLREGSTAPVVCVAGGTGFAPIKSMLDDMVKRRVSRPVWLFWGARLARDLYLLPAIDRWRRQLPDFHFVPALSVSAEGGPPGAYAGMVHEAMLAHCGELRGHELYCCGSPAMVAAVREAALGRGVAASDFHSDVFVEGGAAA